MQPQGVSYGRMLDSTLWSPILAELTKLSIVAQQPLQARTYFNAPSFKQEMEEILPPGLEHDIRGQVFPKAARNSRWR